MGASQSSNSDSANGAEVKTSYYELLGVPRQASDEEIKKAYRRKALELHPDRNYGNEEGATKLFSEIQSAYQVLSDPQERAWYDSHESAILRGAEPGDGEEHYEADIKVTTADEIASWMRKFNGRVDFSDAPTGFFGFLREKFEHLAKEEEAAADWEGVDIPDYPSFGHKDDEYDDVVKIFYAMWGGFSTRKTFAWKDKWRMSEAPDRRYRRAMEKENQQLRDQAKREFNDAVQTLVAFVRKRDPRYAPNFHTEEDRQKALREAAASQAARQRAANAAAMKEHVLPEWATHRDPEELEESEEEEIEEEHFECVACKKTFKSEKQWDAHEKSKKHQKAVQALRRKMQKENRHLNLDDEDFSSSGVATPASDPDDHEPAEALAVDEDEETLVDDVNDLDLDDIKKEDSATQATDVEDEAAAKKDLKVDDDDDEESESEENSGYAPRSKFASRLAGDVSPDPAGPSIEDEPGGPARPPSPKMGKAAQKRAKRAAKAAEAEKTENKFQCARCNAGFPSKTRLFQHINDFDHAAPVPQGPKKAGGKKGKKK